jgi:putative AphA-like transcriptional regulator
MLATLARKTDPEFLEPRDCVALIVLQTADTGRATIDEVQAAARQMTHDDWAPTTAVLESCIRGLVRDGLLTLGPATETDHPQGFATTESGRIAMSQLLLHPIPPSQGNFTRLCMSMKLCLFHCLEPSFAQIAGCANQPQTPPETRFCRSYSIISGKQERCWPGLSG